MRFIYTKTFAVFSGFLLLLTGIVFLESTNRIDPVKRFFWAAPRPVIAAGKAIAEPAKGFFVTIYNLRGIVRENSQLAARLAQIQGVSVELEGLKKENEVLRRELNYARSSKAELVPCGVLAKNAFGLVDSISLSCGSQQGIVEGSAIISQGYLVGKITRVSPGLSTALLARAANFLTDAKIVKSGAEGVLKGSYGFGMTVEQLSQNASIEKGWLVATAGIDPKIPKNLPIGEVGEIVSNPNELLKKATVLSPIDFKAVDFVFVVK